MSRSCYRSTFVSSQRLLVDQPRPPASSGSATLAPARPYVPFHSRRARASPVCLRTLARPPAATQSTRPRVTTQSRNHGPGRERDVPPPLSRNFLRAVPCGARAQDKIIVISGTYFEARSCELDSEGPMRRLFATRRVFGSPAERGGSVRFSDLPEPRARGGNFEGSDPTFLSAPCEAQMNASGIRLPSQAQAYCGH